MKILIVLTYYAPYMSGVTEYARMLAEDLAHRHDVTVLTTQHAPELAEEEFLNGVRVVRAPVLARLHKGVISASFVRRFIALASQSDAVNLHLPMLESGLFSLLTARRKLSVNYQCDMAVTGGIVDRLAVTVTRLSCFLATWRASRIGVITHDYADSSVWIGGSRKKRREVLAPVKQSPDTIDDFSNPPEIDAAPLFTFGFVGRFVAEKGLPILLSAFSIIHKLHPGQVRLVLVGDTVNVAGGGVLHTISASIRELGDSVQVRGRVQESELKAIYHSLDALVLPSVNRYEAFGMVQLEAMRGGALVISSDLPGVRTIVQRTGMGEVVPVADVDALVRAMKSVIARRGVIDRNDVIRAATEAYPTRRFFELQEAMLAETVQQT